MNKESVEILKKYFPQEVVGDIIFWLEQKKIHFTISRERTTKLGDYRPPVKYPTHRISVNKNLNKYAFLITFVHELAHLLVYEKYGIRRLPHGPEWKGEYKKLMNRFLEKKVFPPDIYRVLTKHIENSKASSNADVELVKVLKKYDKTGVGQENKVFLEELKEGAKFVFAGRGTFVKLEKKRVRYRCEELRSGKVYMFHPLAEVTPVE